MSLVSRRETGGRSPYYTPLKKVKGHLDHIDELEREGRFAKSGELDGVLNLTGIEVLETDSPYAYKTAEIKLKFSNSLSSGWVIFEDSIATALGKEAGDAHVDDIIGMDVVMEREDDHLFFKDNATGKENRGTIWRVSSVDGVSSATSPLEAAINLLNGKSADEFKSEAIKNPSVKRDAKLITAIISDEFFASEGVSTLFNVVDGKFVRK